MSILANPRHEIFAQELAKGLGAAQAYETAGFKRHPGNAIRLSNNEIVRERINEILSASAQRAGVTVDRIVDELQKIAFADIREAVEWDSGTVALRASSSLGQQVTGAISEVRRTKDGVSIKFHDKLGALEKLGKHLDMFRERVEHSGQLTLEALVTASYEIGKPAPAMIEGKAIETKDE